MTAVFTGVLTVFTGLLYRVNDRMNETTRRTQRAFVSFGGMQGVSKLAAKDDPKRWTGVQVGILWSNGGSTPTRNGLARSNAELWPYELPSDFDFRDIPQPIIKDTPADDPNHDKPQPLFIAPHGGMGITVSIPVEDLDEARNKKHIFIWGWTTYDDVFDESPRRLSEYCIELVNVAFRSPDGRVPDIHAIDNDVKWDMKSCSVHNCADEDCPDYKARTNDKR
jgi:hypothetical protein